MWGFGGLVLLNNAPVTSLPTGAPLPQYYRKLFARHYLKLELTPGVRQMLLSTVLF
ncbi:MAG: hypothetical protein JWR44_3316, partial [Hymenobacter sp.]|nr:hypothetical protein [Hymenobacter sp.]